MDMTRCDQMDMTPYDQKEVTRYRSRPNNLNAAIRFALHVQEVTPTHVWPPMVFADLAVTDGERGWYLNRAIKAWDEQTRAECNGTATRKRHHSEEALFHKALYRLAEHHASCGQPSEAAATVARLLEADPEDPLNAMEMLQTHGVFPARETETAMTMRM